MYDRAYDDKDTISQAFPNLSRDGASSIYYASLTSSIHKMNGTRKRAHIKERDGLSTQNDDLSQFPIEEELHPDEIEKLKDAERKKHRWSKGDHLTKKERMKSQVLYGQMN